jgi:hypothetical protein
MLAIYHPVIGCGGRTVINKRKSLVSLRHLCLSVECAIDWDSGVVTTTTSTMYEEDLCSR